MKRIICTLLAILMCLSALTMVSCGNNPETEIETNTHQGEASVNINEDETKESLDIPDARYDGEELVFLTRDQGDWSSMSIYAGSEQIGEDPLSDAVYTRNDMIYQKYGVIIKEFKEAAENMPSRVQNEVNAPTGDFQAIVSNVTNAANFSSNAFVWDLYSDETSNIDLSKSWWDQKMVEGFEINDRIFFATGDLLTLDNDATSVMMFNKKLAEECQIHSIYDMVSNYEWTFDKLFEYEQLSVVDSNGDGKLEYDQGVSGFAFTNDVFYSMFYAGGLKIVSSKENGTLAFDLNVERAQDIADSAKRLFSGDYALNLNLEFANDSSISFADMGKTCFGENHALFFGEVLQCVERMRGFDVDFGVIPYPMYDKNQNAYYHMMHRTASVVSIPRSVHKNIEMVAAMI